VLAAITYQKVTTGRRLELAKGSGEPGSAGIRPPRHSARRGETLWHAPDGHAIRRIDWPRPRARRAGSMLFLPGRGDAYEKYLETLRALAPPGLAGDGSRLARAGRLGPARADRSPATSTISRSGWQISRRSGARLGWRKGRPACARRPFHGRAPRAARGGEQAVTPDALVLSAPMLGFLPELVPPSVQHATRRAGLMARLGDPRRPAWKWSEKPGELPAGRRRC
jgi:lysophospholipase